MPPSKTILGIAFLLALSVAACIPGTTLNPTSVAGSPTPAVPVTVGGHTPTPIAAATATPPPPTPWDCGWPYCGPTPSATPPEEDSPLPTPTAAPGPPVNPFAGLLGPTPSPDGWSVAPCEGQGPFLCVAAGDRFLGSVELFGYPAAENDDFARALAAAGLSPDQVDLRRAEHVAAARAALRAVAAGHMASIAADRAATYPDDLTFTRFDPAELPIGELPGLAYGFAGLDAAGRAHERWLTYLTSNGRALYFFTAFQAPDAPGSFVGDEELLRFEPYLRRILAGLRLTPGWNP